MRKVFLSFIFLLFVFSMPAQLIKTIKGNNVYKTIIKEIEPTASDVKLSMDGVLLIKVMPDSVGFLTIYAEENIGHLIETKQKAEKLDIKFVSTSMKYDFGTVLMTLYVKSLSNLTVSGSGIIDVDDEIKSPKLEVFVEGGGQILLGNVQVEALHASVNGGGDIKANGKATTANYVVFGNGEIRAQDVEVSEFVKVSTTISGTIRCYPLKKLQATMTGTGNVYYRGNPEISKKGWTKGEILKQPE